MKIVIELAEHVTADAEHRVRAIAAATQSSDVTFNGDTIVVQRGDFTALVEGDSHSDAAALFSTVQQAIEDSRQGVEWPVDGPFTLVPKAEGGYVKMTSEQLAAL